MGLEKSRVQVNDSSVPFDPGEGVTSFLASDMPDGLLSRQLDSQLAIFKHLADGGGPPDSHAHLPVVATFDEENPFPVYGKDKATGLLPRDEHLDEYIAAICTCLDDARDKPWEESRASRMAVAKRLYQSPEHIDRRKLGFVEIFQGQKYRGLKRNSSMTIQYTDLGPDVQRYQLNGVVEFIGPGDPRFDFLYLMRMLIEYNAFHMLIEYNRFDIQQSEYPSGYVYWISEIFDKSPRNKSAGRRIT